MAQSTKKLIWFFALVCCFSYVVQAQQGDDENELHLYLLIGQSNMAGRGKLDEQSKKIHPEILMLDSNDHWVPATDPVHFDKPKVVGVGPAIAFAEEMLKKTPKGTKIGLIPCAWGGSPIKVWVPGAGYLNGHPYDDAIKRAKFAMQNGTLKGILWHQGESDNDSLRSTKYLPLLKELIERLRTDLKAPEIPFVAGEIGYFFKPVILINDILNQVPETVHHTAVVSAKGLTHKGDEAHFDTPSARELGKRYASAMKKLQNKKTR